MTKCQRGAVLLTCLSMLIACDRVDATHPRETAEGSVAQEVKAAQVALFDALSQKDRDRLSASLDPNFVWAYVQPDNAVFNGTRPTIITYAEVIGGNYPQAFTDERPDLAVRDTVPPGFPQVIARSSADPSVIYTRWRRHAGRWIATEMVRLPSAAPDSGPTMY